MIKVEKDIYVRDRHGVKIHQWIAGDVVPSYVYHSVLRANTVVNPEDLPVTPKTDQVTQSLHSHVMETKVLPEEPVLEEVVEEPEVVEKPKAKAKKKKAKK